MKLAERSQAVGETAAASLDGRLLRYMLKSLGDPPVRVKLWNGETVMPASGDPIAHIRISDRASLLRLLSDPEFQFGECFCDGTLEVEGDLVTLLETLIRALSDTTSSGPLHRRVIERVRKRRPHTPVDWRNNARHHYDLGNEFYQLWLDRQMSYTCAYFPSPDITLEAAQIAKMDHVCRKLRLQPGETVVEAGCGWGALALHMADALRRSGQGVQHLARADRVCARARARPGRRRAASNSSRTITATSAGATTRSSRSACSSTSGPRTTASSAGVIDRVPGARRPRAAPQHRPRAAGSAERLDREADLPRRLPAVAARDDGDPRAAAASRCSTSRTCACTTR